VIDTVSMRQWRLCEVIHASSAGYSAWTLEERLIGLAIIDFFRPDQQTRRGNPPIDLDVDPENDVSVFGAVGCDSPEEIVTKLLL
jgi:hypothetical protein